MNIPQKLTAGDTWQWDESIAEYPASTWTLTFYFSGPAPFNIVASPNGADFAISVTAIVTADYTAGDYQWVARVSNGTQVTSVDTGQLILLPDLSDVDADHRSFNRRALEALQAVIENRATTDQLSFTIAGRSLTRMSWDELLRAYDRFRLEVASETGDTPGRAFIRFGRA
jgi:hypothetical protein